MAVCKMAVRVVSKHIRGTQELTTGVALQSYAYNTIWNPMGDLVSSPPSMERQYSSGSQPTANSYPQYGAYYGNMEYHLNQHGQNINSQVRLRAGVRSFPKLRLGK